MHESNGSSDIVDRLFDPLRVEDFIQDLQLDFDMAKAGRYDDRAKLSAIASATTNPELRNLVRGWMRNGMPNKAGGHTAWRAAKWEDGVEALRICYPNDNLGDRSADDLSDFVQTQHADPHIRAWLQLREDVGSPVDMDSTSKLDHEALLRTLADTMHPKCKTHPQETMQSIMRDEMNAGTLRRVRHIIAKCQQTDKILTGRAKKAQLINAQYWVDNTVPSI
jgi:hypothetical protein